METIFVDSPPIEIDDMALREEDAAILAAANAYLALQTRSKDYLDKAEDRLISGGPGTIYLKRLGHRALSQADFENIINAVGSEEDKNVLIEFAAAQQATQDRLRNTRAIGLVMEQADITRGLLYKREKQSYLWKPEEIIKVMEVLDRLRV